MASLLEMRGIIRSFGAVRANDGIDLDVARRDRRPARRERLRQEHADEGAVRHDRAGRRHDRFRGLPLAAHRPADAMAAGIAMIHQHFMLVEAMTVPKT